MTHEGNHGIHHTEEQNVVNTNFLQLHLNLETLSKAPINAAEYASLLLRKKN